MNKRVYIAQAIPYVNAAPHVGHALEYVQADCLARFWRASGYETFYSDGADENSLKNVQAAEKEGVPVQKLVDKYAKTFSDLKEVLNLTFDVFNRTSSPNHFKGAQKLWSLCKKEDIYKKKYHGLYCVGCEQFYTPSELIDGKCPEHLSVPEEVEEENYFFKLSNYQKFLEDLIEGDKLKIVPQAKKNEITSFIKSGLEDFSISRSRERARGWGVPVPNDNSQVLYVWFDALVTYLTALGFGSKDEGLYKKYWLENKQIIQVLGKGINRFHTIYWPAMLASAGLPLPTEVFVHGYITVDGQKISKSLGNSIDPLDLVNKYGSEVIRYFLLREIPAWGDGDFSERRLKELYNGELANGLGNLVARVARLAADTKLNLPEKKNYTFKKEVSDSLKNFRFDQAIFSIWEEISKLDKLINEQKPWELESADLKRVISPIAVQIREIAFNLSPFMPETSAKILAQFTGNVDQGKPLFPRI
ncbi:MAG: class I tRNA ligase family protein [Patescibacteria group bacterium]